MERSTLNMIIHALAKKQEEESAPTDSNNYQALTADSINFFHDFLQPTGYTPCQSDLD